MALNFSHRPVFSTRRSDEKLVSPMRIANGYLVDGNPERSGVDGFGYGGDRFERGGSQDSGSSDILDILPSDPFGMDISTTVTAITGWLEDMEVDYGVYGGNEVGTSDGGYDLLTGLNLILNNAMRFQAYPGTRISYPPIVGNGGFGRESGPSVNNILNFGCENWGLVVDPQSVESTVDNGDGFGEDGGSPHTAMSYALAHLGLQDLLGVERVCRSLRSTVCGDSLLWRNFHIDFPLNERITDEILLHLTNRAQGNLQSLSLVECPRITDDGLRSVLETNLKLTKLSVPGCTRLSIEGIMNGLRSSKSMGAQGVKQLRIGGFYGVTTKQFEELKSLLATDSRSQKQSARKPHFYSRRSVYLASDDDRDIDIELCPRCHNLRLVYDCPIEEKDHPTHSCRACTLCISRCSECGRCFIDNEYEETFCLELLCSVCMNLVEDYYVVEEPYREVGPPESSAPIEPDSSSCIHG